MSADRLGLVVVVGAVAVLALRSRDQPADDDLPWQARRYLSGAWGRYKRMVAAAEETGEKVDDWEEIRRDGKEAAAEINEIRRDYGQDPIEFKGVGTIEKVDAVSGRIVPENIGHDFTWDRSKPYDPTEDVNAVLA